MLDSKDSHVQLNVLMLKIHDEMNSVKDIVFALQIVVNSENLVN